MDRNSMVIFIENIGSQSHEERVSELKWYEIQYFYGQNMETKKPFEIWYFDSDFRGKCGIEMD